MEIKEIKGVMGRMRPMGLMGLMGIMSLMSLMGLIALMGCSEDQEKSLGRMTVEGVPFAPMFVEEGERGVTRSDPPTTWTPDSPYVTYDNINGKFTQQKDLMNKSINIFFTQDGQTPMEGTFFYRPTDKTWQLNMDIETSTYYLYGYIPKEDAEGVTISPNEAYSDGAVLTINGLNAVTHSDVCVIIGAKEGSGVDNDATGTGESIKRLRAGQFAVHVLRTVKDGGATGNNYIFLLFEHLYSALRFRFSVNEEYAALRTIKLRKLELTTYADKNGTGVKAKYNATITLKKNDDKASPIEEVEFTPVESSANVLNVPIFEGEVALPTYPELPEEFLGCFVPGGGQYFKLRCTYDVYDSKGNLIRQGCEAENNFNLKEKFGSEYKLASGHCFSYDIIVQPTYLYILSDPDLDNPTIIIN